MIKKTLFTSLFLSIFFLPTSPSLAASKEVRDYAQYALDYGTEWASRGDWVSRSNRMESYREAIFEKCFYSDTYSDKECYEASNNLLIAIGRKIKPRYAKKNNEMGHYETLNGHDARYLGRIVGVAVCGLIKNNQVSTKFEALDKAYDLPPVKDNFERIIAIGRLRRTHSEYHPLVYVYDDSRYAVISENCDDGYESLPDGIPAGVLKH